MTTSTFARSVVCVAAGVVALAGCGDAQTRSAVPQSGLAITPATSSGALLYVSDTGKNDVYALSYPSGTLVVTLTGFQSPQGICTDQAGDVFVTDVKAADIVEYAHGGTTPIQTLSGSGRPVGCAVDPSTGNLAVSNLNSFVSIYKNAIGNPANYSTSTAAVFCAYDNLGNLYVSEPGQLSTGNVVQILPSGGSSFENVGLDKRIGNFWPAGLQWVGKDLVVAHSGPSQYGCCGRIYRFKVKGTSGKHAGSFQTTTDLVDFFVYGTSVITTEGGDTLYFYSWPKGKGPTKEINEPGYSSYGITVSV